MTSPVPAQQARRPGVPSIEVELADGRGWGLALPKHHPRPVVIHEADAFGRPKVRIEQTTRLGYPLEIRRLWDAVVVACRDGTGEGQVEAFFRLAVALLVAAHDIDPARAEALLDPGRVDLCRIAGAILPPCFGGHADQPPSGER